MQYIERVIAYGKKYANFHMVNQLHVYNACNGPLPYPWGGEGFPPVTTLLSPGYFHKQTTVCLFFPWLPFAFPRLLKTLVTALRVCRMFHIHELVCTF